MRSSKQSALENVSISPALDNYNTMGAALLLTVSKHGKNVRQRDTWNQNAPSTMYMILITVGLVCGMALLTFENVDQHHIFN